MSRTARSETRTRRRPHRGHAPPDAIPLTEPWDSSRGTRPTLGVTGPRPPYPALAGKRPTRRAAAAGQAPAAPVQPGEGLLEQGVAVGVAAPLAHVGQVGLVRLGARRRRRVLLVLPGRQAAARAVPVLGDVGVAGEGDPGLVPVRAPEGDPVARRGLAALGLAHRTCSDPGAPNRVATSHERPLIDRSGSCGTSPPRGQSRAWTGDLRSRFRGFGAGPWAAGVS